MVQLSLPCHDTLRQFKATTSSPTSPPQSSFPALIKREKLNPTGFSPSRLAQMPLEQGNLFRTREELVHLGPLGLRRNPANSSGVGAYLLGTSSARNHRGHRR